MKKFWVLLFVYVLFSTNMAIGAEGGMPQLNPEFWPSQIFWIIIIFLTLYVILWKIFLPKISYSIENRKSKVVNDLNDTQKLKDNAENKLKEYDKIIEDSKKEAKKIIEDNKKILNDDIENKKQKFNLEIEKEIQTVEKEIHTLKKNSVLNINKIAIEISGELVKEILKSEVNTSSVSAVVEELSKKKVEKYL